jgi:hypothetical protein
MLWRVAIIGANQYYNLTLDPPTSAVEIGRDGGLNRYKARERVKVGGSR